MARSKRTYGDGGITERSDGKHQAQYRAEDGRRLSKTFATKRAASAWLAARRVDAARGIAPTSDTLTVGQMLDRWYAAHAPTVRPQSQSSYRGLLDRHLIPYLGSRPLARLTPADLAAFYADRRAAGVGTATLNQAHVVLRMALQRAAEWGLTVRNVADLVKPPRHTKREMRSLAPEQAAALLAAAGDGRFAALNHLMLLGGLRIGEALAVRWSDIDWHAGAVVVARQLVSVRKHGGLFFDAPKSAAGKRSVPLLPPTLVLLRAERDRQQWQRQQAGDAWRGGAPAGLPPGGPDQDLVTCTALGGPVDPAHARRAWHVLRRSVGLPAEFHPHSLRHTYGSLLAAEGINPKVVQERLGHSTVALTLGTYTHTTPAMHAEATDRLTRLIQPDWQRIGSEPATVAGAGGE